MIERIPFEEAISEPLLLKKRFAEFSIPQRAALKIFYGCPLTSEELDFWAISQGSVEYDYLGYPTKVTPIPYIPQEYEQAWCIWGRRSGKTDTFSSTVLAYEAALGGHENYIRKGAQQAVCFMVAQNLALARQNLPLILATIESSPLLKKQIGNTTADFIELKNGIAIGVVPPTAKSVRGYAVPVIDMDEVGVWYTDSDSANPDFEIERAVTFAQGQFPNRKRLGTSTPLTKEGLLWKYNQAGTEGVKLPEEERAAYESILVLHATTAAVQNPLITKKWLEAEYRKDPDAFDRECLAHFSDVIAGFLNAQLVKDAVDAGVKEREPLPRPNHPEDPAPSYIAALDPAFRRDAFGFTIVHNEGDKIVQDVVRRWKAEPGTVLNPQLILEEIAPLLQQYRIVVAYSDQYQLESLQQLAMGLGFHIEGVDFTSKSKAKIFGNVQQLVNQGRLRLLDHSETVNELIQLERHITSVGGVQIAAPPGKHDDMAAVTSLAAFKAVWMMPVLKAAVPQEKSLFEKCIATIKRKKRGNAQLWD